MKKAPLGLKYYLAGPMTGLPKFNYPHFELCAARLRGQGYEIVSPHEIDHKEDLYPRGTLPMRVYLRAGIQLLLTADAIVFLEGWQQSDGSMFEFSVAAKLKMSMWHYLLTMPYPYELP